MTGSWYLYAIPLTRDARRRLCNPEALAERYAATPTGSKQVPGVTELRSLYDELSEVVDFRRAQGRKHSVASVLALVIAARLMGVVSPLAVAQLARQLPQDRLKALGVWRNPKTGRCEAVCQANWCECSRVKVLAGRKG